MCVGVGVRFLLIDDQAEVFCLLLGSAVCSVLDLGV